MSEHFTDTDLRNAHIISCRLDEVHIRDCSMSGARIVDCYGENIVVSGGFDRVIVNDIDVTAYVEDELDRVEPLRVAAREATTPDDFRAAWQQIQQAWGGTLERVHTWPEGLLRERVDGEWSLVETLRHLIMASDKWFGDVVVEEATPFCRFGIANDGCAQADLDQMGLDPSADPTLHEVLAARIARVATVSEYLHDLTAAELDRRCAHNPIGPYPTEPFSVRKCLSVVLEEEAEHHRYTERDLAVLAHQTRESSTPAPSDATA